MRTNHLPVDKQRLHIFFEECLIMETGITTPSPIGTGEGDVLPFLGPGNLVALALHAFDELIWIPGVLQHVVDGLDQIQLPAVGVEAGLVLAGLHPFHSGLLLRSLQSA